MRDANKTRNRIERCAIRLFVDQGVAETTIRDISGAAGIAEGTIYRHFASKEDMVWELFSGHFVTFARALDALQRDESTTQARIASTIAGFCRAFDSDTALFRFLLLVQHGQLRKVTADMPNPVEVVRSIIVAGIDSGEIPDRDPDLATAMVMGVVLQVATFRIYGRLTGRLADRSEALANACWRMLAE